MAAVRHRESSFLPLPCPGQAEENYLDAAGADAGRCAGDRWERRLSMARKVGEAPAARGAAGAQKRAQGGRAFRAPPPFNLARGPKAPGRQTPQSRAAGALPPPKAGKSPAPRSMGPGARNAVRKGRGNGFAPRAKPGPMAYGPGRLKPPAAGYLPQGVRTPCYQPARSIAARVELA